MRWLDRMERKYSRFAIHHLILYIVFANAAVFILDLLLRAQGLTPVTNLLVLVPELVMRGQIWRLITFVMIPPTRSVIFAFFVLYFYYRIGLTLEHAWGSFKFNIYYLLGVVITVIASFLLHAVGIIVSVSSAYLNATLFLAFATLYPNYEIRLYMILPIKMKYLAYLTAGYYVLMLVMGSLSAKIMILAGVSNYLIFFGRDLFTSRHRKVQNLSRKQRYVKASRNNKPHSHKCTVCGRTELDDPSLEFRYCSKCDGYHEYCSDHLLDHEHISKSAKK